MDVLSNYMEHTIGFVTLYVTNMAVPSVYTVGKPSLALLLLHFKRGKSTYSDERGEKCAKTDK